MSVRSVFSLIYNPTRSPAIKPIREHNAAAAAATTTVHDASEGAGRWPRPCTHAPIDRRLRTPVRPVAPPVPSRRRTVPDRLRPASASLPRSQVGGTAGVYVSGRKSAAPMVRWRRERSTRVVLSAAGGRRRRRRRRRTYGVVHVGGGGMDALDRTRTRSAPCFYLAMLLRQQFTCRTIIPFSSSCPFVGGTFRFIFCLAST